MKRSSSAVGAIGVYLLLFANTVLGQANGLQVVSSDYLMTFGTQLYTTGSINYCLTWRIVQGSGSIYSGADCQTTSSPPGFSITGEAFAPHFTPVGSAGTLVGVTIYATAPANILYFGANYIQVFLTTTNQIPSGGPYTAGTIGLIGGNASAEYALSWPTSPVVQPLDSRGFDLGFPSSTFSSCPTSASYPTSYSCLFPFSAPGGLNLRYKVKNIEFKLDTGQTAGARAVQVLFTNGQADEYQAAAPVVQMANVHGIYNYGAGMVASSLASGVYLWQTQALPTYLDLSAYDGPHTLYIQAIGWQSGDQITSVLIRVEAWNDLD